MESLKIILPFGLILFFITGVITNNIHKEAEQYLSNEEKITGERNRQILSLREAIENYENERRQAQEDREFKRRIGLID